MAFQLVHDEYELDKATGRRRRVTRVDAGGLTFQEAKERRRTSKRKDLQIRPERDPQPVGEGAARGSEAA